jgi:CRP/FNR family transcriptional regulator, dissimilatory nitrate respiration regulator
VRLEENIVVLQATAAFRDVAQPVIQQILEGSQSKPVKRGEHLFLEGQAVEWLYVLVSGAGRTFYLTKQAREFTVEVHSARAVLGIQALFQPAKRYATSADMLETGEVLCIEARRLERLTSHNAELSNALLRFAVSRSGALMRRVNEVFFADLNSRMARLLLVHEHENGWLLPRNTLLAAELATVPELVSRKLGEFYRMGFIGLAKRRVSITNRAALNALVEQQPK